MSPDPFAPQTGTPDSDSPIDLSALGPRAAASGPARWEALAARIEAAAAPELARRAAAAGAPRHTPVLDLVPFLARALRPALAVAAAAAVAVVVARGTGAAAPAVAADTPDDVETMWLAEGRAPSREALARAIGLAAVDVAVSSGTDPDAGPVDSAEGTP